MKYTSRNEVEKIGLAGSYSYEVLGDKTISRILSSFWIISHSENKSITPHFKNDGFWEAWITLWISKNVAPGSKCIDVGANYGYFTLQLALHGCKVTAIEVNKDLANLLNESVDINGVRDKVNVISKALGNGESASFGQYDCMNYSVKKEVSQYLGQPTKTLDIETVTLDSLAENGELDWSCDFIKIDIEGAEEMAWDGMQDYLSRNPKCVVLMEFAPILYAENGSNFLKKIQEKNQITYVDYNGDEKPLSEWKMENEKDYRMLVIRRKRKAILSELLHPRSCTMPKVRYGNQWDGGYVMVQAEPKIESIYTFGVGDDISFEIDYLNKANKDCKVFLYDHTIDQLPADIQATFYKQKATAEILNSIISGLNERDKPDKLLKIDIEGDEYELLLNADEKSLEHFQQIIIEFHDVWTAPIEVFEKLNKYFYLVHIHGNNHAPSIEGIPQVMECTYYSKKNHSIDGRFFKYLPKDFFTKYPTPLDFPNNPALEDYRLDFYLEQV